LRKLPCRTFGNAAAGNLALRGWYAQPFRQVKENGSSGFRQLHLEKKAIKVIESAKNNRSLSEEMRPSKREILSLWARRRARRPGVRFQPNTPSDMVREESEKQLDWRPPGTYSIKPKMLGTGRRPRMRYDSSLSLATGFLTSVSIYQVWMAKA